MIVGWTNEPANKEKKKYQVGAQELRKWVLWESASQELSDWGEKPKREGNVGSAVTGSIKKGLPTDTMSRKSTC